MTTMANHGKAKNDAIQSAIFAIIIIAVGALCAAAFRSGIQKTERAECMKWQREADAFKASGYYLTAWQAAQCAHYGININTITKN